MALKYGVNSRSKCFCCSLHFQQYHSQMAEARQKIEERMERSYEYEKEASIKGFSTKGLRQPTKQSPQDVVFIVPASKY